MVSSRNPQRRSILAGVIIIFLILVGDLVTGAVSSHAPGGSSSPRVPLGTWTSMPSASTELLGNTSYRGMLRLYGTAGLAGIVVGLAVNCITPSNTLGAILQLQYANITVSTQTLSTFANIGGAVKIDNSTNWACPGLLSGTGALIPSYKNGVQNTGHAFRVMGSGGGGIGDNPRFASINVIVDQDISKTPIMWASSISTTGFTANAYSTFFLAVSTAVPFDWLATNTTSITGLTDLESGSGSCTISVNSGSCSQVISFPTTFIGTPNVVITPTGGTLLTLTYTGSINLLSAQTLTV